MLKQSKEALTRDKEKLEAWLASFTNSRESNRKSAEYLRIRRLQLISQLSEIFPIQVLQSLKKSNLNRGRIHNESVVPLLYRQRMIPNDISASAVPRHTPRYPAAACVVLI